MFTEIMLAGSIAGFYDTGALTFGKCPYYPDEISIPASVYIRKERINDTKSERYLDLSISDKIGSNYFKLESFRAFVKGWDGYDALPIPAQVINKTMSLLEHVNVPTQVFPTGRESIQVEIFVDEDNQLEIEVFKNRYEMYAVKGGEEKEGTINKQNAIKILNSFVS